jgi:hypothetical protein
MTLTVRPANDHASFKPGGKAMGNDAESMRTGGRTVAKICGWAAVALLLTILSLATGMWIASCFEAFPETAAPGWPSVSC